MTESRKNELLESIKYDPKKRPNSFFVFIRSMPFIYSVYLKIRRSISRNIYTRKRKNTFIQHKELFILNKEEEKHIINLRQNGITILEDHLSDSLLGEIEEKANIMFEKLDIDKNASYNTYHKRLDSLLDMSYEELAVTELRISLQDPLIDIPELINVVFDESLLKILSNYLGYIPTYTSGVSRSFPKNPPIEPSFFHKDSQSVDVVNIFIYLTDVDEDRGPFCYIPKSHNHSIQSCKPRSSADMNRIDSYGRISDEEMKKYYPKESWFPVTGKKGTILIADTTGLHKGPMWNDKPVEEQYVRDMIQIQGRGENPTQPINKNFISKEKIKNFTPLQKLFLYDFKIK